MNFANTQHFIHIISPKVSVYRKPLLDIQSFSCIWLFHLYCLKPQVLYIIKNIEISEEGRSRRKKKKEEERRRKKKKEEGRRGKKKKEEEHGHGLFLTKTLSTFKQAQSHQSPCRSQAADQFPFHGAKVLNHRKKGRQGGCEKMKYSPPTYTGDPNSHR